jgi:hypothetical protein
MLFCRDLVCRSQQEPIPKKYHEHVSSIGNTAQREKEAPKCGVRMKGTKCPLETTTLHDEIKKKHTKARYRVESLQRLWGIL